MPETWPRSSPTLLESHRVFKGDGNIKYKICIKHDKSNEFV